ncbi:MAG: hypothetical protein QGG89_16990, partial [Vicinamibacterales bacterium]|nr:hypothetical protein [Vicinamibacterales bacterium]
MSRYVDRTIWGLTIGLVVLLVVNFAFEEWMRGIALQSLARGLVALGLLILWRTGLISFGHALFFGVGAYTAALLQRAGVGDAFVLLIAGTLAAGLLAYGLGFLLRKYRAIYFALLNMAFSMILYGVLAKLEVLGSTDGIGVHPPTFLGFALPIAGAIFGGLGSGNVLIAFGADTGSGLADLVVYGWGIAGAGFGFGAAWAAVNWLLDSDPSVESAPAPRRATVGPVRAQAVA